MNSKYLIVILLTLFSFSAYSQKQHLKTEKFIVYGNCGQCKDRIEGTLKKLGAYQANWNEETNLLTVSFDSSKLSKLIIQKKLANIGHDSEGFTANDEVYKKLPDCCHYERPKKQDSLSIKNSLKNMIPSLKIDTVNTQINHSKSTNIITGIVLEEDKKGKFNPINRATIHSLNDATVVMTDSFGVFKITGSLPMQLSIRSLGYKTDMISIIDANNVKIILKTANGAELKEITLTSKNFASYVSTVSTLNTLNITSKELTKAACCNLSESFETSPSVDVSYSDAVTGMKQIQLLGLSGNYTQITTENIPEIRGLYNSYGLTFIPGPFIESIQVTKGTGSVVNGYESIAGQINIEEKKPDNTDKIFINSYVNNLGRLETSINLSKRLNSKWSTALMSHANGVVTKNDENKDGFLDIPLGSQINVMNRWKYMDTKGLIIQFAAKALTDHRRAGEADFNADRDKLTTNKYGVGIDVQHFEVSGKIGYVFPQEKYKSIGFIFSAIDYNNNSYYGLNKYDGKQGSFYANIIYQSIISTTSHKFRTGVSFVNERFNETYNTINFKRKEIVPGSFFEYTYYDNAKFTAIAGFRLDYHNEYGLITTPRLHLKYDFTKKTNLRFSMGTGCRVANIFAENVGSLISSRQYNILYATTNYGYGLKPEKATNYGFNLVHQFKINNHGGSFSVDAYRTDFSNQTVVDIDANPQRILFYDLRGKSFSNSVQAEINYELIKKLDLRLAYRWLDVQTDYNGSILEKPLTAKHRAFLNLAYETKNHWKFDITTQWFSSKRMPNNSSNPADKQLGNVSPAYFQMSGQVTKLLGKKWELYVGAENLSNYTQNNPIVAASQPFSQYFDASMVWGPINGRIIYAGFRYRIKQ